MTIHYKDPDNNDTHYPRVATQLPPEPKEIKPHPYGVELGMLVTMLQSTKAGTLSQFLTESFSPRQLGRGPTRFAIRPS